MLDFRRNRRLPSSAGAALERRLLAMIVGAGVVVLLIVGAGNPRNWRWLVPERPDAARQQRVGSPRNDVVIAASSAGPGGEHEDVRLEVVDERLFPGVRADYLGMVRDDTEFRPREADGWFHLFALLQRTPNDELVEASEGRVSYLQLDQQPKAYRGHVVTVDGVARAAKSVAAPENAYGVKQYYQVWLQPSRDSDELIVVYALELPEGFPIGPSIEADCSAVGFFYKRWAYQSRGGVATAPLVISKTLDWQPPPAVEGPAPTQPLGEQLLTAVIAALLLAGVVLLLIVWRGRAARDSRRALSKQQSADEGQVGAALASLENEPHETDKP